MGATSVTGVGAGAAEPNRGPGNNRNQYVSLLDPHVVFSGTIYIDTGTSGNATVVLPQYAKDVPEKLMLVCGAKGYATNKNLDGDGMVESFDIFGAKKRNIDFVVIKDPSGNFTNDINP